MASSTLLIPRMSASLSRVGMGTASAVARPWVRGDRTGGRPRRCYEACVDAALYTGHRSVSSS